MANLEQEAQMVESTDLMAKAIHDAMNRIKEVGQSSNLVDQLSMEEWLAWDASDELALVADSSGIDGDCELEDDALKAA